MENTPYSEKKLIWANIIFFAVTALGCVVGAPLYLYYFGISGPEIILFVFYLVATGLSITVGYHRHFAHATFQANPVIQFLLLFFGAAAFEQTCYMWSSQHRDHHRYVDTDRDPYSIKKGFWYAHIGWMLFWTHKRNYQNVKDLDKNPMVMHQHKYYFIWAFGAGVLLPVLIGAMTGHALGALIFAVCTRITLVYHSTFFINSVCHMFGKATYDIYATAKDHWFIALLTYGEGYHNFHHRFPSDYRNGVRWYQWDPSKWVIVLLEKVGLTSKLCRVSRFSILSARIAAENRKACDRLTAHVNIPQLSEALDTMKSRYELIRSHLSHWEVAAREYKDLLAARVTSRSQELREAALKKMEDAQKHFQQTHQAWKELIDLKPIALHAMLLGVSV